VDVEGTQLTDLVVLRPKPFRDARGFFTRTFDADSVRRAGVDPQSFVQDSQSRSGHATLRGLHFRTDGRERKIVRCASGSILDVVVDLRPPSPTFGRWQSFRLDDEDHLSLVVPPGFGHGFQVLSERADVCYRMDAVYAPEFDATLRFDDPDLAVEWPLPTGEISQRDQNGRSFRDLQADLVTWFGSPA
jgi:dTDP-4-dehydrorhamnose 3,5-epimerase